MALLISGAITFPFNQLQSAVPQLSHLTSHQVRELWMTALHSPPRITIAPISPQKPFTVVEDWAILTYLQRHPPPPFSIRRFFHEFGQFIHLTHLPDAVAARSYELAGLPASKKDSIIDEVAKLMCQDYFYALSLKPKPGLPPGSFLRPKDLPLFRSDTICDPLLPPPDEDVDLEAEAAQFFESDPNALAVLRGETVQFAVRRRAIAIGCSRKADIDLTPITHDGKTGGDRPIGGTRPIAAISLQQDLGFWIENIGMADVIANGVRLQRGQWGLLPNGVILDFAGKLLMFVINRELVRKIGAELERVKSEPVPEPVIALRKSRQRKSRRSRRN
jgi:hypothetical protein